ncbi:MAG: gas vesicle protein [Thermoleophilia bacterium]|nr:gas vesicle protein [Thermoleophilia bacterium]
MPYRGAPPAHGTSTNLADILERVLDKGIVIAGDIRIDLLDIELLTIKLRLLVASVDKAKEMGIDWWERDGGLSSLAESRDRELDERLRRLEAAAGLEPADADADGREQVEAPREHAHEPGAD